MKKEIPIKNLYYLLSYAWEFLSQGTEQELGTDTFSNSTNLMARLMDIGLKGLLKRGVSKDYIPLTEEIRGLRGKLYLSKTLMSGKLKYGKTICSYDDFGLDHLINQIIKASILVLLRQKDLNDSNSNLLHSYFAQFEQVTDITLSSHLFSKLQLHSNTRHYRFVLKLSQLISNNLVISSNARDILLSNFLEDSVEMKRVFEKFIKNFYSIHLKSASVVSPKFNWSVQTDDTLFAQRVPELRTDVVIDENEKRLIIDAKYYVEAMKQHHGVFKYRRDHLSQLMEYMRTSLKNHNVHTRGMLLYPTVNEPIDNSGKIEGYEIRIATLDLSVSWEDIEKQLLYLATTNNLFLEHAA